MAKLFTLKKNNEFRKVYQRGTSVADKFLVLYCFPTQSNGIKFGYSISKKVGGAVIRNRLRRIFKEICRKHQDKLRPGWDIIIIARLPVAGKDSEHIERSLLGLFKKAKLLVEKV